MRIETTILKALLHKEDYARKVLPFLKPEYFKGTESKVFKQIENFYIKYNGPPSSEVLSVDLNKSSEFNDGEIKEANELVAEFKIPIDATTQDKWLLDRTEEFCQEKALFNAIYKSIGIIDGKDKLQTKGAIPTLLSEALAVCFDPNVGHDFIEDAEERYDYYHSDVRKIPFDLEMFNKITKGGVSPKTLNIVMAGTGVGKTIFLCHLAAAYMAAGHGVLYITLEMAQEEISKRVDANLLNIDIDDLMVLPKADYLNRVSKLKQRIKAGKLIVKEYPTAGASTLHFKNLLNELNLKKGFKPAIIIIDYLNICLSSRIKSGTVGMYQYVKSITEEVRGLGVEFDVPIWSATQVNRTGFSDSDPNMDATSESFGLPMTADLLVVLIGNEKLYALQQIMVKQLKNRYADVNKDQKFVLSLNKDKMQFADADEEDEKKAAPILHSQTGEREELPWEEYRERVAKMTEKTSQFKY